MLGTEVINKSLSLQTWDEDSWIWQAAIETYSERIVQHFQQYEYKHLDISVIGPHVGYGSEKLVGSLGGMMWKEVL